MNKLDVITKKYLEIIKESDSTFDSYYYLTNNGFLKDSYGNWRKSLSDDPDDEDLYIVVGNSQLRGSDGYFARLIVDKKKFVEAISKDGKAETAVKELKIKAKEFLAKLNALPFLK